MVAGPGFDMSLCLGADRGICLAGCESPTPSPLGFRRHGAMINERVDGDSGSDVSDSSVVIGVEMRRQQIVDLFQPGVARGSNDAPRVAASIRLVIKPVSGKAGVHEQ